MIELSANTALMLYLLITTAILLSIWSFYHYSRRSKQSIPLEQQLYICEYCHFVYLEEMTKQVTKCPQCQSFNKDNFVNKGT